MQNPIEITGLMVRTWGEYIIVELEIDSIWRPIFEGHIGIMETSISHIIEPLGIRRAIETGKPIQG